jgi:hypothetical protein
MSNLIRYALATLLVPLAIAVSASEAHATRVNGFTNCTVFNVEFSAPSSDPNVTAPPRLIFHCSKQPPDTDHYTAYYASVAWGCPVVPLPQVQVWNSMVAVAYITGMSVTVSWSQDTSLACPERSVTSINLSPPG